MFTIGLVGEVSSGKSSFLNSLVGQYISNTALLRETYHPYSYILSRHGKDKDVLEFVKQLAKIHEESTKCRADNISVNYEVLELKTIIKCPHFDKIKVIDFPGINDSSDKNLDKIIESNIKNCDLILFITDAKTAFIKSSEVNTYKFIKELVGKEIKRGHYVTCKVIVNKFDDFGSSSLNEIMFNIPDEIGKVYKYSSHKQFIETICEYKLICRLMNNYSKKEFMQIVCDANYRVSDQGIKSLKNKNLVSHYHLIKQNDVQGLFEGGGEIYESGDILIDIKKEILNIDKNRIRVLSNYLKRLAKKSWYSYKGSNCDVNKKRTILRGNKP